MMNENQLLHTLELDFPGYLGRDNRLGEHDGFPIHSVKKRMMYAFDLDENDIYYFVLNSFKLASGSYTLKWMNLAGRKSNKFNKTDIAVDYLRSHYGWVITTSDDILGF